MTSETLKIQSKDPSTIEEKGKTSIEKIKNTYTDEIVLAICAPIGSVKDPVITELSQQLEKNYKYEIQKISLSELIKKYYDTTYTALSGRTEAYSNLKFKIDGGNNLRKKYNDHAILAELAIKEISIERNRHFAKTNEIVRPENLSSRRKCYIIDSLKKKQEIDLLRSIYKDIFYSFSIFSSKEDRIINLTTKGLAKPEIDELIVLDDYELNEFGQDVRNTFIDADFFLRTSAKKRDLSNKITRYLHLIFESAVVTPYHHEYAMYVAKSAAGNSACLSRQVGAAIMSPEGVILSKGWNDVPKYGGNLYSSSDNPEIADKRCYIDGYCRNDTTKDSISNDITDQIKKNESLKKFFGDRIDEILPILTATVRNSRIKDLIEFSRSVHAEMHAIITGSQLCGSKIIGSKLFTTTYPCHNCARHIVAAGITEIYYIEPYVKSLSIELHKDSITESEDGSEKVKLLVYDGVAPRRYLEFFSKNRERKQKNGKIVENDLNKIGPKVRMTLQALSTLEQQAIHSLSEAGIKVE